MFSLKNVEKALVLLGLRQKMLKNHWFYRSGNRNCWKAIGFTSKEAEMYWKSIGFTMFSLQNIKKALVLRCFRSKSLKKHWFYCVFAQKYWKIIGFTSKEAVKQKKPLVLQSSLCKWILKLKKVKKPFVFPEKKFGFVYGAYEKLVLL